MSNETVAIPMDPVPDHQQVMVVQRGQVEQPQETIPTFDGRGPKARPAVYQESSQHSRRPANAHQRKRPNDRVQRVIQLLPV